MKNIPAPDTVESMGLRERMQWILDNRPQWNARSLSLKAGQSEGYIRKLLEREPVRPDVNALAKIAELARVNMDWFIFGRGAPDDVAPSAEESARGEASEALELERALGRAFDARRHLPRDMRAVEDAVRNSPPLWGSADELTMAAAGWLDAAASLRAENQPITAQTLLVFITTRGDAVSPSATTPARKTGS